MSGSAMRPRSFRHTIRGPVVEINMAEYTRTKQRTLKIIRRRVLFLSSFTLPLAIISFGTMLVIWNIQENNAKFQRIVWGVANRDIYLLHGIASLLFSFHGFYLDGNRKELEKDGMRFILHIRVYSFLGAVAWFFALWLIVGMISAFGLLSMSIITKSIANVIYLTTLSSAFLHLIVTPWILRTIHRKGSQADEYFGAEFINAMNEEERRVEVDRHFDEDASNYAHAKHRSSEHYEVNSARPQSYHKSQRDTSPSRKAVFNAEGSAVVVPGIALSRPQIPNAGVGYKWNAPEPDHQMQESGDLQLLHLDSNPRWTDASGYWALWQQLRTTGSFSCKMKNRPSQFDVEAHLRAHGFHVMSSEANTSLLQVHFYGAFEYDNNVFLCEFIIIHARNFFQATFKCQDEWLASSFVTRFQLQELFVVDEEGENR